MPVRVAIPVPTSFDSEYNERSWPEYARAVETVGGESVKLALDLSREAVAEVLSSCQAVVLPGSGADVNPTRYGHETQPETAPADLKREEMDLQALEYVERTGTPLLAICFGLQSLNVYRGGTLVQHLLPVPVNHRAGRAVASAHAAIISTESRLGRIVAESGEAIGDGNDGFERILVNSSHHQAAGTPGEGLRIVGRSAEDAVIEALEDPDHPWLMAVQWHPERTMETSPASRAIFKSLLQASTK